jgi:hypothetical protein
MVNLVLAAFSATGLANISAQPADFMREVRAPAHKPGGGPANDCTVFIEPNAFRHFAHVLFAKAGVCTMFAFFGAPNAGVDTGLKFFV